MFNKSLRHRCLVFHTPGKIIYDPKRNGMKTNNENWCVIEMDNALGDYYRHQFYKRFGIQLIKPSWDIHLSVLKGKTIIEDIPWGYKNGTETNVIYGHELFWNDTHVWLNCYCEDYWNIRNRYETVKPIDQGHITIGKFKKEDSSILKPFPNYNGE